MAGHDIFNSSPEARDVTASFHGVGSSRVSRSQGESMAVRMPTRIDIPKEGSTSREESSRRQKTYSKGRSRRPAQPSNPFAKDNFDDDDIVPAGSSPPRTARRSGFRPSPQRTTLLPDHRHSSSASVNASAILSPEHRHSTDKGKGKARGLDPSPGLPIRQPAQRRASRPSIIHIEDDSDDDIKEVHQVAQTAPRALNVRSSPRLQNAAGRSNALAAKDKYLESLAEGLTPAGTETFYARSNFERPEGPIRLEEPSETRNRTGTIVRASPEQADSPHFLDRSTAPKPPPGIAQRMKARDPSPRSVTSNGPTSRASPGQSSRANADQDLEVPSHASKRRRTEPSAVSNPRRQKDLPSLPHEVRLGALVVSDIWRSHKDANPVAVFQVSGVHLGYPPEHLEKIPYCDIREVAVSSQDVETDAILSLILRNHSSSAKRMQELFPDYDPCASGDAAEIHLIAKDAMPDFEAHKQAIRLVLSKADMVSTRFLTQPNSTTKVKSLSGVMQANWPRTTTTHRNGGLSSETKPTKPRTKIVPGAGRTSEGRDSTRTSVLMTPSQPRSKAFDIQPPSPKSASNTVARADTSNAATYSMSSAPTSPSTCETKPTNHAEPQIQTKLPFAAAPHDKILTYPYEGTNAITLQASDFERLMDGELLNDLNIEFGLKLMHEDIRKRDPVLADSIHIFNTFFYKLLSTTPVAESFSKLRKWTGKAGLDLFSKKYVVVPINEDYHWYLAVIVNPGAMLRDPNQEGNSENDGEEVGSTLPDTRKAQITPSPPPVSGTSIRGANNTPPPQMQDAGARPSADSDHSISPPMSPLRMPLRGTEGGSASTAPTPMDLDDHSRASTPTKASDPPINLTQTFVLTFDSLSSRHPRVRNVLHEYLWREALDKKRFPPSLLAKHAAKLDAARTPVKNSKLQTRAQEAAQKDPEKALDRSKDDSMDETTDGESKADAKEGVSVRKIQVQDTRQSPVPAGHDLGKPFDEESVAKSLPITKHIDAKVPAQPNFCDCGIYLLHYFERFFADPNKFLRLIVEAKAKRELKPSSSIRRLYKADEDKAIMSEWQSGEVSGKREYWRHRIVEMMKEWEAYQGEQKAKEAKAAAEGPKLEAREEDKIELEARLQDENPQPVQGQHPYTAQGEDDDATLHADRAEEPMQVDAQNGLEKRKEENQADADQGSVGARLQSESDDIEKFVHTMARGTDLDAKHEVNSVLSQVLANHSDPLSQDDLLKVQKEDHTAGLLEKPEPRQTFGDVTTPPIPEDWALPPLDSSSAASKKPERSQPSASTAHPNQQSTPASFGASIMEHISPSWNRVSAAFSNTFHNGSQETRANKKQRKKKGKKASKKAATDSTEDSTVGDSDSSVSVTEVVGPSRSPSAARNAGADLWPR